MRKITLQNIALSPFSWAMILSVVTISFLPDAFDRYLLELHSTTSRSRTGDLHYYHDLDGDGNSEKIVRMPISETQPARIVVKTSEGGVVDQWNFDKAWANNSSVFFGDTDGNGIDEIFSHTISGNRIYLEGFDAMSTMDTVCRSVFIDSISNYGFGKEDYRISREIIDNFDDDRNEEILFLITAGHNIQPRNYYIYDPLEDELLKSPVSGIAPQMPVLHDLDGDSLPEIVNGYILASNQIHIDMPYDDDAAWLMVYDHTLKFTFDPIPFEGHRNMLHSIPIGKYIYVHLSNYGLNINLSKLMKFDANGQTIKEIDVPQTDASHLGSFFHILSDQNYLYLSDLGNGLIKFDTSLTVLDILNVPGKGPNLYTLDVDKDGKKEIITGTINPTTFTVYRDDFSHPASAVIAADYLDFSSTQLIDGKNQKPSQLFVRGQNEYFHLSYTRNPFYWLKFPIWIGIYLGFLGFISLIQWLQRVRTEKQMAVEREMARLQLANVKNQFDPHFTFNALNTIASVIYKERKEVAHDYFVKFSRLIRSVLENSDKLLVTLAEEIAFINNYLELQKFRFNNKFNYTLKVDPGLDREKIKVPKMVIQNYVENAINHGLKHLETNGHLHILIEKNLHQLKVIVEDNGIGREKAMQMGSHSTGKGLELTTRLYDLFRTVYNKKIEAVIEDLQTETGESCGTRVTLLVPL